MNNDLEKPDFAFDFLKSASIEERGNKNSCKIELDGSVNREEGVRAVLGAIMLHTAIIRGWDEDSFKQWEKELHHFSHEYFSESAPDAKGGPAFFELRVYKAKIDLDTGNLVIILVDNGSGWYSDSNSLTEATKKAFEELFEL